jgi:phosphatidylglycerol:prolipoprotein diacylglycerol transferase
MLLTSIPVLWVLGLDFGTFWDVASFTILTGMIFARIGCLLNGCCYGRCVQGRFAVVLPDAKGKWERRAPTQLLEAITGAILLLLAALSWRWMPFSGALFLIVILGYSAARFAMEYLRDPEPTRGRIGLAQLTSALLFFSCLCFFTLHSRE